MGSERVGHNWVINTHILSQLPEPGVQPLFIGLSSPLELKVKTISTSWLITEKEWLPPKDIMVVLTGMGTTSRCPREVHLAGNCRRLNVAASAYPGLSCWWSQMPLLTWNKYTAKYFSCKDSFWGYEQRMTTQGLQPWWAICKSCGKGRRPLYRKGKEAG